MPCIELESHRPVAHVHLNIISIKDSNGILHYITRRLADAFIQSDLQLIRLSRRHTPWSNVGLRASLKGPAVQILSRLHQGSNHRPCGSKSSSLTTTLQPALYQWRYSRLSCRGKAQTDRRRRSVCGSGLRLLCPPAPWVAAETGWGWCTPSGHPRLSGYAAPRVRRPRISWGPWSVDTGQAGGRSAPSSHQAPTPF